MGGPPIPRSGLESEGERPPKGRGSAGKMRKMLILTMMMIICNIYIINNLIVINLEEGNA
jgi:hypothetical protein